MSFFKRHKIVAALLLIFLATLMVIFRPKSPKKIDLETVKKGNITQSVTATGTIDSGSLVNLSFQSGGKIAYLGVKKGDHVEAGQIIASLDQRTVQKNLETALRTYAQQRNKFEQTVDDNNPSLPLASQTKEIRRILEDNQYDLDKAVLSVELQELAREQSVLTTPISGIVIRADASTAGVSVAPTTVFTIADPDDILFKIDVDEADIGKINPTQRVKVTLDAYPDDVLNLPINNIDFASHNTATGGTAYTVEAKIPHNDEYRYRIGMGGDAEVIIAEKKNVLTISLSSIIDDKFVYVKQGKKYDKRRVVTGLQDDTDVEIVSGLRDGEQVVTQPSDIPDNK